MLSITNEEFDLFGCPNCGCDSAQGGNSSGCGRCRGTCRNCQLGFEIRSAEITDNNDVSRFGTVAYHNRKGENGRSIMETAFIIPHPRIGIPAWIWEPEDIRPGEGEYWSSRGASDWDVSGFVRTKQAGERILAMVHEVLDTEECTTFLDFRPREPNWIQFKFHASEFDVNKLDDLTPHGIITKEIIQQCKL